EVAAAARTLLGRPMACVGRERELGVLLGAWAECVEAPCAQAAMVTGAPGAGKSRLRGEFLRRVAARGEGAEVWIAAGDPVGARSPLGMVSRWIRRAGALLDGDPLALRQQKLRARLSRHLGGDALDRAAAFLGEVAGAPLADEAHVELRAARRDPTLMGTQVRLAFEGWLAAESAAAPMLLVLEDLQWGDLASARLIGSALRSLGDRAVLLLAVARPDLRDDLPAALGDAVALTLALGPLPDRACEVIARDALGEGADPAVIARLVGRSEGNPLYLEELVRAVADGRGDALPETLLAMLSARLDRLDPQARRALRAASVFGQDFADPGVAALLGGVERAAQVGERLRELVAAEVLVRRGEGYAFRHALLREASYAQLTEADRALGHRLAGRWLLETGEGDPAVLAEHFARGELPELAAQWFRRAAEQSLDASALGEALEWAARARASGAQGEALGAVRRVEARARSLRDENAQAAAAGEEALALLPRGGAAWHLAAADLGTTALRIHDHARLVAIADDLAAAVAAPDAVGSRVIALARTAIHLIQTGHPAEVARLRAALDALVDPPGDPAVRAWRTRLRAVEALRAGDPAAYRALTEESAAAFEQAGDRGGACAQRGNVGYALQELGDYAGAAAVMREALAQAEALGMRSSAGLIRHNLGLVLARTGAVAEGLALEAAALAGFVAQGHRRLEGFA
ncbi:MAG: AAA family ATPase, partial [Deltaproteobacteria bacterium]|nr:AAA family ATPase [Deltaproteobacteria bacterium]